MPTFEIMLVHVVEQSVKLTIEADTDLEAMDKAIQMGERGQVSVGWAITEDKYEIDDVSYPNKTLAESEEVGHDHQK